jgi:hypothetical protein
MRFRSHPAAQLGGVQREAMMLVSRILLNNWETDEKYKNLKSLVAEMKTAYGDYQNQRLPMLAVQQDASSPVLSAAAFALALVCWVIDRAAAFSAR